MKRIVIAVLLSAFVAVPAIAGDGKNGIGISYGLGQSGVYGFQGEFDISAAMPHKAPVAIQAFWKNYSQTFTFAAGTYQYSYNGFGVAGIYDFSSLSVLDKKFKPYAGVGLYTLNNTLSGPAAPLNVSSDSGGIYVTVGMRYAITPEVSADLNYNNIGELTIGANFNF